jgi:hypothetical protein
MNRTAPICVFFCMLFTSALAEESADTATPDPFDCMPIEGFQDATADTDQVRVNNFSLRETSPLLGGGARAIEISYAVANRMDKVVTISADFLLLDGASKALAVINSAPMLNAVQPGKTDTATGSTFVNSGTLALATRVCMRVFMTWRQ